MGSICMDTYFLVNNIRMPYLGRNVISGFNATLWPGSTRISHSLQIVETKRMLPTKQMAHLYNLCNLDVHAPESVVLLINLSVS